MTEKEPRKDQGKGDRQMTTTIRRLLTTSAAFFQRRSLRTKVTIFTLAIFLIGIWALAFFASDTLHRDMEKTLSDQQFSTVSVIAADINDALDDRLKTLEILAAKITPAMLANAASMQTFLESHVTFQRLFNYGGIVLRCDGLAIAEVPNHGRIGINYSDRDYMIEVLKGKPTISKTVIGKTSRSPFFSMLTPIRDAKNKVIGILAGATDLGKPDFLTKITDHSYGKTGGYLLVSRQIRTIVFATDKKRIMEVLPAPGINPLIDRFIQGYEGSGITIRPSDGVETLSSAKGIPVSGWYLVAQMPTDEAFAPVHALQKRVLLATSLMTLLAGALIWFMLKHQLAPALTTIKTLATLASTDHTPAPLPITRQDEIGELIGGFNRLLETLGKREEELRESHDLLEQRVEERTKQLRESEEKFRIVADWTYDWGYWISPQDRVLLYISPSVERITGYGRDAFLADSGLMDRIVHPDDRPLWDHHAKESRTQTEPSELTFRIITASGEVRWIGHVCQVVIAADGRRLGSRASNRDITRRKLAEETLLKSEERLGLAIEAADVG
ncbi:MAG: PAS domain-containing protein, partial [Syntrophales bacterium]